MTMLPLPMGEGRVRGKELFENPMSWIKVARRNIALQCCGFKPRHLFQVSAFSEGQRHCVPVSMINSACVPKQTCYYLSREGASSFAKATEDRKATAGKADKQTFIVCDVL